MLNPERLKQEIQGALEDYLPGAMEVAFKATMPQQTKHGDTMAERFGETVTKTLAEPLAQALASAIDYHVKSISCFGTIITAGSPVTQTAVIMSPSALTNGKVPNSIGIM